MRGMIAPRLRIPQLGGDLQATMSRPSEIDPIQRCMEAEESASWRFLNRRTMQANAATPCWDCTEGFAAEMRSLGLCDGSPGEPVRNCPTHGLQDGDWWIVVRRRGGPPGYICRRCNDDANVERERLRISALNHANYLRIMGDPEKAAHRKVQASARRLVWIDLPWVL